MSQGGREIVKGACLGVVIKGTFLVECRLGACVLYQTEDLHLDIAAWAAFTQEVQYMCGHVLATADSKLLERDGPSMEAVWFFWWGRVDAEQECWLADVCDAIWQSGGLGAGGLAATPTTVLLVAVNCRFHLGLIL